MAVSAVIANPLRLTGSSMPPQIVLLCRLLVLALLLTNHQAQIQTPFLPFLDIFDQLPPELTQRVLQVLLVVGSIGILFTKNTRLFAAVTGMAILFAAPSSRGYYGNNKTFVGLMLVLAALSKETVAAVVAVAVRHCLLRRGAEQVAGSRLADGQFFYYWATDRLQNPAYIWLAALLPPLVAGKIFCWYTIIAELVLAVLAVMPRFHPAFIWERAVSIGAAAVYRRPVQSVFLRDAVVVVRVRAMARGADSGDLGRELRLLSPLEKEVTAKAGL